MGTVELPNLDDLFGIRQLLELEHGVALFYMHYVAFGFKFSGSFEQLSNLMCEIDTLQKLWGHMHRN